MTGPTDLLHPSPAPYEAQKHIILHVMSEVHPGIILGIPIAFLVPLTLLNPN